jgi:Zn-dependent M16 (insulinase) family peptidase
VEEKVTVVSGFELTRYEAVSELDGHIRIWRHRRSGAELLSVENADENKAFGLVFRTPPPDATGLPHVLEHMVLGGSRLFPIRNPLDEVINGSLATYVNALTFPDKTGFLAASQNTADLYNLVQVLLDAAFHPLLERQTFLREGWRYELESLDGPLTLNGVVLNEQRGNFSAAARLIEHYSQIPLFPDTPYGVNRGGDPAEIPNLTYERLVEYHRSHYHPPNCRIYFYGNDDPEKRLCFVDRCLRNFRKRSVDSTLPLQISFDRPRFVTVPYDAGGESDRGQSWLTVNWVLDEVGDPETIIAMMALEQILIGTSGSPLHKALIRSGLGSDLAGIGLFLHVRQPYFSTGLQGIDHTVASRVEALIDQTLRHVADKGIDPGLQAAALNTISIQLREANFGHLPRGLGLLWNRASITWIHDGDPLALLAFERPLQALAHRLERGEQYFENLIRKLLVNNPHRVTVLLAPDQGTDSRAAALRELEETRATMSTTELERLIADTRAHALWQATPDPPEALVTIPSLTLSDMNKRSAHVPCEIQETNGCTILYHDLPTSGILYLDLAFNLHTLPQKLVPYAPLFGRALIGLGTDGENQIALAQRIGHETGGISSSVLTSAAIGTSQAVGHLVLRGKAAASRAAGLFEILRDILLVTRLDNREVFGQLMLQATAEIESNLLPWGAKTVRTRLGSRYGEAGWLAEQLNGVSQLSFLRRLAREIEHDWSGVHDCLEQIRQVLLNRNALVCNVTVDNTSWTRLASELHSLVSSLPARSMDAKDWRLESKSPAEGLIIPTQVNYVAKGANLYEFGYRLHGSVVAITRYLEASWLMKQLRMKSGAYGGMCVFHPLSGLFTWASYRDPNVLDTLQIFDQSAHYLRKQVIERHQLTRSIIGACGQIDRHERPETRAYSSMCRYLSGESLESLQQFRDELLTATVNDVTAFAEQLERVQHEGNVVVMGSRESLDELNGQRHNWLELLEVL